MDQLGGLTACCQKAQFNALTRKEAGQYGDERSMRLIRVCADGRSSGETEAGLYVKGIGQF